MALCIEQLAEHGRLNTPFAIIQRHEGHLATTSHLGSHISDDTGHQGGIPTHFQLTDRGLTHRTHFGPHDIKRVTGKEKAQGRLFFDQPLSICPAGVTLFARRPTMRARAHRWR